MDYNITLEEFILVTNEERKFQTKRKFQSKKG